MALIELTVEDGVGIITLNRPERRNAMNAASTVEMKAVLAAVEADPAIRVAVLTGAGKFFSAGMDLAAFAAGENPGLKEPDRFAGFVNAERSTPVIAAVEGGALAGGFEMMLACDMVVAAKGAIFGLPEVKRGLFAAAGGVFRLARRVPVTVANEMILAGRLIDADRAHALGLVNEVTEVGQALAGAMQLAREIAQNAPLAVAASLKVSLAATRAGEAELWALSDRLFQRIETSEDAHEGAVSFTEKRPAVWKGR